MGSTPNATPDRMAAQKLGRLLAGSGGFYAVDTISGLVVGFETAKLQKFILENWGELSRLAHLVHDGDRRKEDRRKA